MVLELLSYLDAFIPTVKLLVHSHGLFDGVVLDQDCLSLVELLIQHCEFDLDSEVIRSLGRNKLVKLA